jgi:hypothetical protein
MAEVTVKFFQKQLKVDDLATAWSKLDDFKRNQLNLFGETGRKILPGPGLKGYL